MSSRPVERFLPERRGTGAPYRIAIVCLGNICRSPIAQVVLTRQLERAGLDELVEVVSAGTGDWHVGNPMDRRAAAVLTAREYDATMHRARQFEPAWLDDHDLVLAMDESNLEDLTTIAAGRPLDAEPDNPRIRLFRDFDPRASAHDRDVPDPYYGGDDGFDTVLAMVERTAAALVQTLAAELGGEEDRG